MGVIQFQFPGIPNARCVFTGREGAGYGGNISFEAGDNPQDVRLRRQRIFSGFADQGLSAWRECRQVHGDAIIVDPDPSDPLALPGNLVEADGMMTETPGLGLMIKTADCQPVLFADAAGRHIMAIHAGWRGNRINFPASAVARFCGRYNLKPEEVYAVRGPSLGPSAAEFTNFESEWGEEFRQWLHGGKMDLWALTRRQLEEAGIPGSQIYGIDICAWLNCDSWFSHRRDNRTGRQAAIIWISSETGAAL